MTRRFDLFSGMRKRSIPPMQQKEPQKGFGSHENPLPVYDRQAHWDKFMQKIELIRRGIMV